ncbi:hypothetical protein, partial [Burkholderia territorii]|uniref:hypothetical protein n=1 Tax=Burkholderia territorii TaxID=1503055 RepID=UPI001BAA5071
MMQTDDAARLVMSPIGRRSILRLQLPGPARALARRAARIATARDVYAVVRRAGATPVVPRTTSRGTD